MRRLVVFALVALLSASQQAQDKAKQDAKPRADTPEQAADKVLAAVKAKDPKALKALAARDKPDPWRVADEMCYRGEHEAAEAFAKAAPRKDVEKLPRDSGSERSGEDERGVPRESEGGHRVHPQGPA